MEYHGRSPFCNGSGHNGCSGGGKDILEKPLWVILVLHGVVEVPIGEVKLGIFGQTSDYDIPFLLIDKANDLLRTAAEIIALRSIGETPADRPVGGGADERVQHVLDQDVHRVL